MHAASDPGVSLWTLVMAMTDVDSPSLVVSQLKPQVIT